MDFEQKSGLRIEIPAFLHNDNGNPLIFVRKDDLYERRRLSVFHECGHFDIPWHQGIEYFCNGHECDTGKLRLPEREAFEYAGSVIFPAQTFFDDIHSMPVSLETIEILAERYQASFEATAIRYVKPNPKACAIVYLRINPYYLATMKPFIVRYSIKSITFDRFIKKDNEIEGSPLFMKCHNDKIKLSGEIPAYIFGTRKTHRYIADIKPYGPNQLCVFLSLPDRQSRLF